MQHTPNQLNQFFGDCLAGRYDNLPEPQPQIAISDDHEQIIKIERSEGGYNVYRRKPGADWEDAGISDFDGATNPSQG